MTPDDFADANHETRRGTYDALDAVKAQLALLDARAADFEQKHQAIIKGALDGIARRSVDKVPAVSLRRLSEYVPDAFDSFDRRAEGVERPIPVPWPDYAALIGGGYWPGVHVLCAGTGAGKTQFALQVARGAALNGIPTLYIGLEMGPRDAVARVAAMLDANIKPGRLQHGQWARGGALSASDIASSRQAVMAELDQVPFFVQFNDAERWDYRQIPDITAALRRSADVDAHAPVFVVLDFLQIVSSPDGAREDLRERIKNASYACRGSATANNAAVLLVSSISRDNHGELGKWAKGWPDDPVEVRGKKEEDVRYIHATQFVGIGKESGEIEYSAETLTVLGAVPFDDTHPQKVNGTRFRVAVPKARYEESGTHTSLIFDGRAWHDDPDSRWRGTVGKFVADPPKPDKPKNKAKPRLSGADRAAGLDRDDGDETVVEGL
jgi:hypothetical protein